MTQALNGGVGVFSEMVQVGWVVFLQMSAITQKVSHELPKMFVLVAESAQRAQFHSGHCEHGTGDWNLLLGPTVPWAILGCTNESKDIKRAARKVLQGWECCFMLKKGLDLCWHSQLRERQELL